MSWRNPMEHSPKKRTLTWRRMAAMFLSSLVALLPVANVSLAYEVTEIDNGAIMTGRVAYTGTLSHAQIRFEVRKGPEICGAERVLNKVDVHQGLLKGAVIALEGVKKGKPFASYQETATGQGEGRFHYIGGNALNVDVQLKKCSFGPFTGVITTDEAVRFTNHDSIKHTLHTYASKGRKAKILRTVHTQSLRPDSQTEKVFSMKSLGHPRAVVLTCDRHDFMENWLYVVKNPYYAVSDESGNFSIDRIPPGTYDLVVWHPVLGIKTQHVTLTPGENVSINVDLTK